ncbi:MAG: ATP-binding protein [Peptococcaceae bacterium]|jgi:DNA replication protein DnaC|nr:ATP-binding protein [Peptococcaceae bacterium]
MDKDTKRLLKQEERDQRVAEVHRRSPALREADEALAAAGRAGLLAAAGGGDLAGVRERIAALRGKRRQILASLGLDEGIYEVAWDCPLCQDRGWQRPGEPCVCQRQGDSQRRLTESGLTPLQQKQTFGNFSLSWYDHPAEVEKLVGRLRQFADSLIRGEPCGNIFLFGPVGNGKTHLCSAVANQALAGGRLVAYWQVEELVETLREEMYGKGERPPGRSLPERLLRADLLILEDLGAERLTDFAEEQLVQLIDQRIGWQKPWLITSHLIGEKFSGRYDARLVDRVLGEGQRLYLKESSVRFKRAQKEKR